MQSLPGAGVRSLVKVTLLTRPVSLRVIAYTLSFFNIPVL
jgi:hypothetical protein